MTNASNDTFLDLLQNEHFIKWVTQPSPESDHYWARWIEQDPGRGRIVAKAKNVIQATSYKHQYQMPEETYGTLLTSVVAHHRHKHTNPGKEANTKKVWLAAAAALAILVCATLVLVYVLPTRNSDIAQLQRQHVVKETLKGQKLRVKLPDGTRVILNAESKLTYEQPFGAKRNVFLTGEAFFDVTRDEQKPFLVHASNITTRVLGTSFNVRSYPEEVVESVAVVTGKVEVSGGAGSAATLLPAQQAILRAPESAIKVANFHYDQVIGWKDGLMVFNNTPIAEVFERLEQWYGVSFELPNGMPEGAYTGRYQNASLEKILQGVGVTSRFAYKIEDKRVIITKN
ncbi:FecR family protein [Marinoscillum furvescens]|uniref:FecR family protein n=1 Tax=Marinoscillum furvescens DSM 4134 TaxID=1122208 RepID=A0A3D9L6Q0_MARFU|nr:FecR family protein [Marinoscillum furvescens]REE02029.1 FecR family protein [Marinoscillum furvescens DSM 4134]